MLLAGSIAFWTLVAYVAFKPQTAKFPAMGPIEIKRSRRAGRLVEPSSTRVIVERGPALSERARRVPLTGRPARIALPPGAVPMGGTIGAMPMPSHLE